VIQPATHQPGTDARPLEFRLDCDRTDPEPPGDQLGRGKSDRREQNVTNHETILYRNQRKRGFAAFTCKVHQGGFGRATKSSFFDQTDTGQVMQGFRVESENVTKLSQYSRQGEVGEGGKHEVCGQGTEAGSNSVWHTDHSQPGSLGSPDAIGRILESERLISVEMESGKGSQEQVRGGLEAGSVFTADDCVELVPKIQALKVGIHPAVRGTGSNRQSKTQAAGRFQGIRDSGHGRQGNLPIKAGTMRLLVQCDAIKRLTGEFFKPGDRVEVGNGGTHHGANPFIQREFLTVAGIEVLPDLHLGCFGVEDETVEVKNESLDHLSPENKGWAN